MRSSLRTWGALALLALTSCPADRVAQKAITGSQRDVRPALERPAPPALATITNLRTPESVLHDPEQDVYFISNVNGGLLTADANGFITRVDAKTMTVTMKWIESGRNAVRLDAPKGMAIVGDTLYVSDIAGVRAFDRRSGAPGGLIALPGATLVNDLATDGTMLYVSDTAIKPGPGVSFLRTGTDAIWTIRDNVAKKLAAGAALNLPNGLDIVDGRLHVVTFGGNEIYTINSEGQKKHVAYADGEQLDGITHTKASALLVSSWAADAILRGSADDRFTSVLGGIDAPADIGYDATRKLLLVPRSGTNQVTVHRVE